MGYQEDVYNQIAKLYRDPYKTIGEGVEGLGQLGSSVADEASNYPKALSAATFGLSDVAFGVSKAVSQQDAQAAGETAKRNAIAGKNNDNQRTRADDFRTKPEDVTEDDLQFEKNLANEKKTAPVADLLVGGKRYDYTGGKGNYFGGASGFAKAADAATAGMPMAGYARRAPEYISGFGKRLLTHPGGEASAMPGLDDFKREEAMHDTGEEAQIAANRSNIATGKANEAWLGMPMEDRLKLQAILKASETPAVATMQAGSNLVGPRTDYVKSYVDATKAAAAKVGAQPPPDAILMKTANDKYNEEVNKTSVFNRGRTEPQL